jgi:isopenicillin-N epimerase
MPAGSALATHWRLDPSTCYLNHGSFGACPAAVLEAQRRYRDVMEADAVRFFVELQDELMDATRRSLAKVVGAPVECVARVPNATFGVATAMDCLVRTGRLGSGDEILVPTHEYPACKNNIGRMAEGAGVRVVPVELPFPCESEDEIVRAILGSVTARTRAALISHVTSASGMVLPIERLVSALEAGGVRVIVDGAHSVGMVPLALEQLGASFFTANCHKWLCTPKGSAFLYVRADLVGETRPLVLSNRAFSPKPGRPQLWTEFDYCGTDDPTAWIATKDAIEYVGGLLGDGGGWPEIMRRNRTMCLQGREIVCRALGVRPPVPESMVGSIATIVMPDHPKELSERLAKRPSAYHDALQDALLRKHGIQVPIWGLAGKPERFVRVSAQLYNTVEQYEYLARALREELAAEAGT